MESSAETNGPSAPGPPRRWLPLTLIVVASLLAFLAVFRQPILALALIGLLALGLEALRRQTAREYPDARREDSFRGLREWARGVGRRREPAPAPEAAAAGSPAVAANARLDGLERLGRLRETGGLDAAEYQREKTRLLAGAPPG
jgi:hypothetical protein